ncbi:hypothetical protein OEZ85_009944 [Tetradesmus obliquus]|uniref:Protein-tyrosine-phosphatase n=1 Tax=Tetradesmus obliquus TaxID=3088 RepID=A0ABY8UAS6_TETOB|nr:hypothetical protein OEZ85_009944 [Tetradesmus obliquus]
MAGLGPPRGGLMRPLMLDLNFLPRDNGPPSSNPDYEELRRQKFAKFEMQCSKVAEGLYVSGAAVAQDRAILAAHGISHVVNCVGALYTEYFKDDGVAYKTLWLQDIPHEDITCILYDTFDFIENARRGSGSNTSTAAPAAASGGNSASTAQRQSSLRLTDGNQLQQQQQQQQLLGPGSVPSLQLQLQQRDRARDASAAAAAPSSAGEPCAAAANCSGSSGGGHVLVHCSQGVSRSTTIAIAYLMWKTGGSYDEVYQAVRALRGVTSPNVGFMCQLINWAKRRQRPPSRARVYRIAPHCPEDATYLVPKALSPKPGCSAVDWAALDSRGCFVVHLPHALYVWRGASCLGVMADVGWRAAAALVRYEGAPQPELVRQGEEPDDLLAALNPDSSSSSGSGQPDGSLLPSMEPSCASLAGGPAAAGGAAAAIAAAAGGDDEGMALAAGGRLTPRGSLVGLAVDDIGTGGSSSGRSESPATTEGRNRKYRRSETDSLRSVVQSFRQPGRLSASSTPSLWPGAATAAAAVAAAAPFASAAGAAGMLPAAGGHAAADAGEPESEQRQQPLEVNYGDAIGVGSGAAGLRRACSETGQINDIKRMSIDEGDEFMS